jgi:hypothetical protein
MGLSVGFVDAASRQPCQTHDTGRPDMQAGAVESDRPPYSDGYLRLGEGKLVSLGWIESGVELVGEPLGFCCFGFLASRLPRC